MICKQCNKRHVEKVRECYATPVCYDCLPPPEPLPIIATLAQNPDHEDTLDKLMAKKRGIAMPYDTSDYTMEEVDRAIQLMLNRLDNKEYLSHAMCRLSLPMTRFLREKIDSLEQELQHKNQCLRAAYEAWAGSEIGKSETAAEAYCLQVIEQMLEEIKRGL